MLLTQSPPPSPCTSSSSDYGDDDECVEIEDVGVVGKKAPVKGGWGRRGDTNVKESGERRGLGGGKGGLKGAKDGDGRGLGRVVIPPHAGSQPKSTRKFCKLNPLLLAAYEAIPDPILLLHSASNTILYANSSCAKVFSYESPSSLEDLPLWRLLPDQSRAPAIPDPRGPARIVSTTPVRGVRADGRELLVELAVGKLAAEGVVVGEGLGAGECLVVTLREMSPESTKQNAPDSRYRKEFEELNCLGRGGFGTVYRAVNRLDGQHYAIKKVRLTSNIENFALFTSASPPPSSTKNTHRRTLSQSDSRLIREVKTFASLSNHPNVVRYYNAWIEPVSESEECASCSESEDDDSEDESQDGTESVDVTGDTSLSIMTGGSRGLTRKPVKKTHNATLFIQMQLCPFNDLRRWLEKRNGIDRDVNLSIFRQIIEGLAHVHSQNVIHRDIKPENIFVQSDHVYLGDFGLAKTVADHILSPSTPRTPTPMGEDKVLVASTDHGTWFYIAPEILTSQLCTTKSDIYSLGILLFELFSEFGTGMERVVTLNAVKTSHKLPPTFVESHPDIASLIQSMLNRDASLRPSAMDLLDHPLLLCDVSMMGSTLKRRTTVSSFGEGTSERSVCLACNATDRPSSHHIHTGIGGRRGSGVSFRTVPSTQTVATTGTLNGVTRPSLD
ncbi:hypothetical protein HK104_009139, partial [Borealophlyctis nickersoniae]